MTAPLCHYCASSPMTEAVRIPIGGSELLPTGFTRMPSVIAIFQCQTCKRIEAVTE